MTAGVVYFGGQQGIPVRMSTNNITTGDDLFPIMYGRRAAVSDAGYKGIGGTVFGWDGVLRVTGDTFDLNSTRDRLVLSDGSVPWDGTVATV